MTRNKVSTQAGQTSPRGAEQRAIAERGIAEPTIAEPAIALTRAAGDGSADARRAIGAQYRISALGQSKERLLDSGLRLHALLAEAELHAVLTEELAKLLGAQRVLLVLSAIEDGGAARLVGAQVPDGEDACDLLRAITPWLDEASDTRQARLRHGPDGVPSIDQRSCLVAPLVARQQVLGFLYADLDGLFGRFHDADRDLLATLAAQAALALANLRTTQGLEAQVAERTAATAQRVAELALVNRIQQGMAARLDFQDIVDLVGDTLCEVFKSEDLSIGWWDEQSDTWWFLYLVEHGVHLGKGSPRPVPRDDAAWLLLHEGTAVCFGTRSEQLAAGLKEAAPGTDWCLSIMAAPIRSAQRVMGMIGIENHEREHAYGEADLRVLTTIGATLGTALENARLFDETQRLLKETESRNAELAVINSIQQAVSGQLDFQAIVDTVGDKLRAVFATGDISIRWWEEATGVLSDMYSFEHGVRLAANPRVPPAGGPAAHFLAERRVWVANSRAEIGRASCRERVLVQV